MNKYYLISNLTIWCYVALAFKFSSCQGQRTSNRRDHPIWSALEFRTRPAEGFVILPSVRHESTMTPFFSNTLAIGTILANLREIAKAQRTDRYQKYVPSDRWRISPHYFFGNSSHRSGQI
jgi:hypothetical protein